MKCTSLTPWLLILMLIGETEPAPSMLLLDGAEAVADNLGARVVLAAPHAGFDLGSERIAKQLQQRLLKAWQRRTPLLIARHYRAPRQGRYFDVNRPTERPVAADGSLGEESVTPAARRIYSEWRERLRPLMAPASANAAVPLYVEIHGHSRTMKAPPQDDSAVDGAVRARRERVSVSVIEVATVGFSEKKLRVLSELWRDARRAHASLPPLYFDLTDSHYHYQNQELRFRYRASVSKRIGILRAPHVVRALHIELPRSVRGQTSPELLATLARLIARASEFR